MYGVFGACTADSEENKIENRFWAKLSLSFEYERYLSSLLFLSQVFPAVVLTVLC